MKIIHGDNIYDSNKNGNNLISFPWRLVSCGISTQWGMMQASQTVRKTSVT